MTWTAPMTFLDNDPLTASQLNTYLADNLNMTAPAIATQAGRLIVTAGKNQLAERQWVRAYSGDYANCDAKWPADPEVETDAGPTVTFEHGGQFLAFYDCLIRKNGGSGTLNYAPVVEGNSEHTPNVYRAAVRSSLAVNVRAGAHYWFKGLEPGITTLTMKYGATPGSSGTTAFGHYAQRRLTVIPF